jgi:hypothetical protein
MAERARPTLRCLREDLGLAVPRVDVVLEEVVHPLLPRRPSGSSAGRDRRSGSQPLMTGCCSR